MFNKKAMLVAFVLLALITLGAASASDDFAAADLGGENSDILNSPTQDNLYLENTAVADDTLIGDGEPKDLEIDSSVIPSEVNASSSLEFPVSVPNDFSGEVTFSLNGSEVYYNYFYGPDSSIDFECPDCGVYLWELNFADDYGNYNPLKLNGTIEILKGNLDIDPDLVPSTITGTDEHVIELRLPSNFYGSVTFKLNDTVVFSDEDYESWSNIYYSAPGYGLYNWELRAESDKYNLLVLNGTVEVRYLSFEVPEKVIIGSGSDDKIMAFFDDISGYVTLMLDGEKFTSIDLEDHWRSTTIDLFNVDVANHTYELIYSGSGKLKGFSVNGTFDVDYVFDSGDYEVTYGNPVTVAVSLPQDASGKLTADVAGKTFTSEFNQTKEEYDFYYAYVDVSDLNLGENTLTLTYSGNDRYPGKSLTLTVNAVPEIRYGGIMDFTNPHVALVLPDSAKGNLIVKINDDDFANVSANAGVFNVSLAGLEMGAYDLYAYYDGDDFEVSPVYPLIQITPKITVPKCAGYYEGALVTIEVPSDVCGTFSVYKFDEYYYDEDDMTLLNVTQIDSGKASVLITSFNEPDEDTDNNFLLVFENDTYVYKQQYTPVMKYFSKDTDFEIDVKNAVKGRNLVCIVHDEVVRNYDVYLDGKYLGKFYNDDYDYDVEASTINIKTDDLDYGKHKIEFRYVDDDGYYLSKNKTYFFNVTYLVFDVPKEIEDSDYVRVICEENLTGNLTLLIDGVEYYDADVSDVYSIYFSNDDLNYGPHDYELVYSGDASHDAVTLKGSFDFTYWMYVEVEADGESYKIVVRMPYEVASNITLTLNGKKYTARAHDYTEFPVDFDMGYNEYSANYEGDARYPAKTVSGSYYLRPSISLEGDKVIITSFSNSTGSLVVICDGDILDSVSLVNGTATVDLSSLELGIHHIFADYEGEGYVPKYLDVYYDNYNVTAPKYVGIEEGALISVNLPGNYSGKLIIEHRVPAGYDEGYDVTYDDVVVNTTDITNGFGSVRLTTFDGITDPYDDDYAKNSYRIIVRLDNDKEYTEYYNPIVLESKSDFGFDIRMDSEVLKRSYVEVFTNIPQRSDRDSKAGYATLYIDGQYYKRFYDDISFAPDDLDYGTHTVEVLFSGDEYYKAASASATFNVTYMVIEKSDVFEIYDSDTFDLYIGFDENATGFVTVYFDGKAAGADFVSSYVEIPLTGMTVGNHTYEVIYSGDANYPEITKKANFTVIYGGNINTGYCYENDTTVWVEVVHNATGNVELTVGDKKYTQKLVNGTATFSIDNISVGEYEISARYMGDDKYPAYDISSDDNLSVVSGFTGGRPFIKDYDDDFIIVGINDEVVIALEVPEYVEGQLIVEIDDEVYGSAELVDGKAYVTIAGLDYGGYELYAYYRGDSDGVYSLYGSVIVSPKYGDYNHTYPFNSEIVIPIEFESDANGILSVYDGDDKLMFNQTVENGKVTLNLTDKLNFGYNQVNLVYNDGKYDYKDSLSITITPILEYPKTFTVGDDAKATFTFPENFNGTLKLYASGNGHMSVTTGLTDSKAAISLFNLSEGRYEMYYVYDDENCHFDSYYSSYLTGNVLGKDADIEVSGNAGGIKVRLNDDATGAVIAKIDDEYYYSQIKDGEAIFDATGSDVEISYSGDKSYTAFKNRPVNVTEEKDLIGIEITVKAGDIDVGQVAVLNIQTNTTLNGNVTLTVGKQDYTVLIQNGKATKSIENLTAGKYDVTVKFDGDDVFARAKNTTSFSVNRLPCEITIDALDRIAEGSNLTVTVSVSGATGTVTVNGKKYTLTNGAADVTIENVEAGNLTVDVVYNGDDTYSNATKTKTVTVYAKKDANLAADNVKITVGDVAVISISINSEVTGKLTVNDIEVNVVNGSAKYEISDLAAGNYTYAVKFAGDDNFRAAELSVNVTVQKADASSAEIPKTVSEQDTTLTFDMPEGATGNVTVTIGDKKYYGTVKNGKATVQLDKLPKGNYDYSVSYSGDEKFAPFEKSGVLKVDDIVTYISITQVTGKCVISGVLKDIDGNAIAGAALALRVGSANMTAGTDENGEFTIQAQNNAEVFIMFAGKDAYLPSNTTITLKNIVSIRAETRIVGENYTQYAVDFFAGERGGYFKVKLTDASGNPLANKIVNIGYNGKCLVLVSDEAGFVQVQINLLAANTLTFAVAYLGDDKYDASFEVYKITLVKKTTKLSAPAKTYKASAKTKSYTVTLSTIKGSSADGKTYLGANKVITLTVNGKTYSAKTNAKGQATFKLSITKKGTYTATVNYAGDNTYNAAKTTAKIKIN